MNEKKEREFRRMRRVIRIAMVVAYQGGTQESIEALEQVLNVYEPNWLNNIKNSIKHMHDEAKKLEQKKKEEEKKEKEGK